jgi:hypothetical protein
MSLKSTRAFLGVALAALAIGALFASSASAAPAWKFEGKALEGTETEQLEGGAEKSGMTIPGLTTSCANFLYEIAISNSAGTGKGSLSEVPLFNCYTDSEACTVEAINAEKLPWASHLTAISGTNYIVIEGVRVSILYGGKECVLNKTLVPVTGSAGGSISNATETATFSKATLSATGTQLKAFGQPIEWFGVFPNEGFKWHREQALSVS